MGVLTEYYFQPDAPDDVLPEAEVLRCIRRFVPSAGAVTAIDESGGEARTYTLDGRYIVKVQRPPKVRVSTSLAKEVFVLNQLAAAAPDLPVPRVLGYERRTHLLEYSVQTRMPGVAVATAGLAPDEKRDAIFQTGRLLRQLHALPQAPLHASAHFPTDLTVADFKHRLSQYFDALHAQREAAGRPWPFELSYETVRARTLEALPEDADLVALHSNPGPPHVFVEAASGQFQGLIDFGDAYISHPALDLWRWRWPDERAAALDGYTADAPVSDNFLQVWRAVAVLAAALLVVAYADREAEALADLRQSLAEL